MYVSSFNHKLSALEFPQNETFDNVSIEIINSIVGGKYAHSFYNWLDSDNQHKISALYNEFNVADYSMRKYKSKELHDFIRCQFDKYMLED